jgi:hypothetical protein
MSESSGLYWHQYWHQHARVKADDRNHIRCARLQRSFFHSLACARTTTLLIQRQEASLAAGELLAWILQSTRYLLAAGSYRGQSTQKRDLHQHGAAHGAADRAPKPKLLCCNSRGGTRTRDPSIMSDVVPASTVATDQSRAPLVVTQHHRVSPALVQLVVQRGIELQMGRRPAPLLSQTQRRAVSLLLIHQEHPAPAASRSPLVAHGRGPSDMG